MVLLSSMMLRRLAAIVFAWFVCSAHALTPEQAFAIAGGDSDERIEALGKAVAAADERLPVLVQALLDDEVKVAGERAYIVKGEEIFDAASGAAVAEVVERLHDLPGLRAAWRPALEEFNARYHPFQDGAATARVVDGLLAMLPPGPA